MTTTTMTNSRIVLASRPAGEAALDNFRLESVPVPELQDGQVLVRNHYLSLDPYMRMRMNDGKSYAAPQAIGAPMIGGTVGEVLASRHAKFNAGDKVVGMGGWQQYTVHDANTPGVLRKVDDSVIPLSAYLGAVGMPGVTAWVGLVHLIEPKEGETIVVDAASGAVGSAVGQLAKARGCRVVGLAGGAEKCAYVRDELGFDACIDYLAPPGPGPGPGSAGTAPQGGQGPQQSRGSSRPMRDFNSLAAALDGAAPKGIDGLFENVGGLILDVCLTRMNAFGRIALCGMISGYNGEPMPLTEPRLILTQRLKLQGFIVAEYMQLWPAALKELGERVATKQLKYRESVAADIAAAPAAFLGLLKGANFGKQLVKLT